MTSDDNKMPPVKRGTPPGVPRNLKGGVRSVNRLKQLQFDPIGELVAKYRKIEEELVYQEKRRSGEIVELLPSGKPRYYDYQQHMALYDRLLKVGEQLLRYGYGRVPETVQIEDKRPAPLVINLTAKGETYIINDDEFSKPLLDIDFEDGDE